jgi:glycosyltransferase involved in cell wall biosynthesis
MIRAVFLQSRLAIGGAERLVQALVQRMNPLLITTLVVTLYDPGPIGVELEGEGRSVTSHVIRSRFDPRAGARLARLLRRLEADVVYVCDSPLPKYWAGVVRKMGPRPRLVLGYHSTGNRDHPLQHMLARFVAVPTADRLVALSETHRHYLASQFHLPPSRFDVIGSGVDLARFHTRTPRDEARARAGLPAGVPLVGIVAALRPEKNHGMFLASAREVLRRVPEAHFFIAGDGPQRPAIEKVRRELGLGDRVLVLGSRNDVPDLFRAADVAVLSSLSVVETLPVTLLEAAACGVPVVATRVGSVQDVVADGETGWLVPSGDTAALADRLAQLLSDPGLRERMGVAARRRAEREFDEREMIAKYERLFLEVAKARG